RKNYRYCSWHVPFRQWCWRSFRLAEISAGEAGFIAELLSRMRNIENAGIGHGCVDFRFANYRFETEALLEQFERRTFVEALGRADENTVVCAVGDIQRQLETLRAVFA